MSRYTPLVYIIWFFVLLFGLTVRGVGQDTTRVNQDTTRKKEISPPRARDTMNVKNNNQLNRFRRAFKKVAGKNDTTQRKTASGDPSLNIGGIVIDRTRTSFGRRFYNLFYQQWNPPEDAGNFNITIDEKPSPGLGSIVSISIDYQVVYRVRLQPRYAYLQAVSKQAVARCTQIVKQKAKVRKQLSGY